MGSPNGGGCSPHPRITSPATSPGWPCSSTPWPGSCRCPAPSPTPGSRAASSRTAQSWTLSPICAASASPRTYGQPQHENRQHHRQHRRNDSERRKRHPRPDNLINQAAEAGQKEEKKQNPAGKLIHAPDCLSGEPRLDKFQKSLNTKTVHPTSPLIGNNRNVAATARHGNGLTVM